MEAQPAVGLSGGEKAFQLLRRPLEGPRGEESHRAVFSSVAGSAQVFRCQGGDSHVLQTPLGDMALLS